MAVGVGLPTVAPLPAAAQDRVVRRPWTLFDLFGPRRQRVRTDDSAVFAPPPPAPVKVRKPKSRVVVRKAAPAAPPVETVEKQTDARVIMVIGDFLAGGVAEGLEETFANEPRVRVLDRSKGSSGFVRQDVMDWPKEIAAMIEADKPSAIVVMMGSNDRQQMLVGDVREQIRSDGWTKAYEQRTDALAEAIEAAKVPFVWVAMPPFRSAKLSADMLAFNETYEAAAKDGGGEFVDIWDGFSDENGQFVGSGPDVSGQLVRLRVADGINLTKAGKMKIAFYAEKPLRKFLGLNGDGLGPAIVAPSSGGQVTPGVADRTEPIALTDPNLDGGSELMGAPGSSPASASVAVGEESQVGRADDFGGAGKAVGPAEIESTAAR